MGDATASPSFTLVAFLLPSFSSITWSFRWVSCHWYQAGLLVSLSSNDAWLPYWALILFVTTSLLKWHWWVMVDMYKSQTLQQLLIERLHWSPAIIKKIRSNSEKCSRITHLGTAETKGSWQLESLMRDGPEGPHRLEATWLGGLSPAFLKFMEVTFG